MRILIAILLVALGAFPVLLHNNFSFSQMSPVEVAIFIACLIAAALLILVKKIPGKSKEEDSLYQMKFTLSSPSPVVQQGQQLYLRPYMGLDKEQIGVTNDKGECLGFVPGEYREYILSRIEAHRMTHTTVEAVEMAAGNQTISIKIIC